MRLYEFATNNRRHNLQQLLLRQLLRLIHAGHRSRQFKLTRLCGNPSSRTVISARYPTVQSTAEHMPERILAKLDAQQLQPMATQVRRSAAAPVAKPVAVPSAAKSNPATAQNKPAAANQNPPAQPQSKLPNAADPTKADTEPEDQSTDSNDRNKTTSNDVDAALTKPAAMTRATAGAVGQAKTQAAADKRLPNKPSSIAQRPRAASAGVV